MPEFKVQCEYYGERENKFFNDKENKTYHKFCVINANDLPDKYFRSLWRSDFDNGRNCWLWIADKITKEAGINWEIKKDYCFIMNLGENQTAAFKIEDKKSLRSEICNNMVLKIKQYFENTIQKIGFWGNENYFYEVDKNKKSPPFSPKSNQPNSNPTSRQTIGKIILICLPILIFFLLLLLMIKWISKKKN